MRHATSHDCVDSAAQRGTASAARSGRTERREKMIELEYLKRTPNGLLRRQLLECADGWRLSNFELASAGPASLRDYDGGWGSTGRLYATREAAERALARNGWTIAAEYVDPGQEGRTRKNKTRAQRLADGIVEISVYLTREQRDALDAAAKIQGISRNRLVANWADSMASKKRSG